MFKIEEICEKSSAYISNELGFTEEQESVVNYGIFAFVQIGICLFWIIVFGTIFNILIESLIVAFTISILRKTSGGIHAKTPSRCAIIGTIVAVGMALISKKIKTNMNLIILGGSIVFLCSYYIVYKLAPVDSIAKPIKKVEKRQRLKRKSITILSIYLIIVVLNILNYLVTKNNRLLTYTLCMYMGLLWQVFSLTKIGHQVIRKLG